MKSKKAFDIQIVPHGNEKIKRYTISILKLRLIYLAVILFLTGTAGIVIFYSFFVYFAVDYVEKMERVKYLEKQYDQTKELQREIESINSLRNRIIDIFSSSEIASIDIEHLLQSEKKNEESVAQGEFFSAQNTSKIPNIMPAEGWVTVEFIPGRHLGIDISARAGTPFIATADGIVSEIGSSGFWGEYVVLEHDFGLMTKYAHSERVVVKEGEKVHKGQVIGFIGSTGMVTGPHLHYEIIQNGNRIDPIEFMRKYGNILD